MHGNFNTLCKKQTDPASKTSKVQVFPNHTINQLDIKNLKITSSNNSRIHILLSTHETLTKIDYIPGHKTHFKLKKKKKK